MCVKLPPTVPQLLTHTPLHHQLTKSWINNGSKWQQVDNLNLSLTVLREHFQLKRTSLQVKWRKKKQ